MITLPPLRKRPGDIQLLAERFAIDMAAELGREMFPGFSPEARGALQRHSWPGNVRELKNAVERSVYRADPNQRVERILFDPFDSPYRPAEADPPGERQSAAAHPGRTAPGGAPASRNGPPSARRQQPPAVRDQGPPGHPPPVAAALPLNLEQAVRDYEVAALRQALIAAKHNQRKAGELLGLTYHQLRGRLKKHAILKGD